MEINIRLGFKNYREDAIRELERLIKSRLREDLHIVAVKCDQRNLLEITIPLRPFHTETVFMYERGFWMGFTIGHLEGSGLGVFSHEFVD